MNTFFIHLDENLYKKKKKKKIYSDIDQYIVSFILHDVVILIYYYLLKIFCKEILHYFIVENFSLLFLRGFIFVFHL